MDSNYNQQTNANLNQQGNTYQQGNSDQRNAPYQQTDPYRDNSYGNYGGAYHSDGGPDSRKAPNIFQQFIISFIPPQYDRLTKVRTGSMIGFVTLLALIATIISFVSLALSFGSIDRNEWERVLPDFEIKDGRLYIEEDFTFDESNTFIYMTDKVSGFSYDDASSIAAEGYRNILLVGRDGLSVMQDREYQQGRFSDLGSDLEISRDWIVDTFMPIMVVLVVIGYIIFFVGRVFWYFLCAAIYLVFALIIASVMKKQQSAGALFRIAVYSKVLMFVVATLLSVVPIVGFSVPFMLRIVVTIGFMGFAIAKLPDHN